MSVLLRRRRKLRYIAFMSVMGIVLGAGFAFVYHGAEIFPILNGAIIGFVIGAVSMTVESFVFQERFRRLPFSLTLAVRTMFYVCFISVTVLAVILFYQSIRQDRPMTEVYFSAPVQDFLMEGEFVTILLYTVFFSFGINFLIQINRMLGQSVLKNYALGRYHRPKQEWRIFLFMDLKSSTTIAENMREEQYHQFLNDFFYDVADPIIESKGEIYQYVGDEVIVSWPMKSGIDDANCMRCFFRIEDAVRINALKYERTYGIVPEFKAGMHGGPVIVGEIGDLKQEISYSGNTLNTASRIQAQCNVLDRAFLVSEDILTHVILPPEYRAERMGSFTLRGKQSPMALYAVTSLPLDA